MEFPKNYVKVTESEIGVDGGGLTAIAIGFALVKAAPFLMKALPTVPAIIKGVKKLSTVAPQTFVPVTMNGTNQIKAGMRFMQATGVRGFVGQNGEQGMGFFRLP
jgi:hypothetical protein